MINLLFQSHEEYVDTYLNDGVITQLFLENFLKTPYPQILDEINSLEFKNTLTKTVKENMFTGKTLKGLWKKHFYYGGIDCIAKNIQNEWLLNNNKFNKMGFEKSRQYKEDDIENFNKAVVEELMNTIKKRTLKSQLTGEWIIFLKYNEKNYYLTLASHKEEDACVLARIKNSCFKQYPFLEKEFNKLNLA